MNKFHVIPAIDILNGELVRLTQGSYDQVENYAHTPIEMAQIYEDNGISRLHIVDLDGAKDGKLINHHLLEGIRETFTGEIEFGGGVRNQDTVEELRDIGIDYIILGSLLIKDFKAATDIIQKFPSQIIAGIDAKNGQVATEGWIEASEHPATALAKTLSEYPLESIIYTDIAKDGMMQGPNLKELRDMAAASTVPIIASGGIRNKGDINDVKAIQNITGCIIGKAILSGNLDLSTL